MIALIVFLSSFTFLAILLSKSKSTPEISSHTKSWPLDDARRVQYTDTVKELINKMGFSLTGMGKIMLDFVDIDRNEFDMALAYVLPAIADDYFVERIISKEPSAQIQIICALKFFFENNFISKNQFDFACQIVFLASKNVNDDIDNTLRNLRIKNYGEFGKNFTLICYANFLENPVHFEYKNILDRNYNEYINSLNTESKQTNRYSDNNTEIR